MDFTFLGTGAGMPAKERNVSALAVSFPEYDGDLWLFDCGEGTQRQILYTPVRLPKLSAIFITHLHGDHIYGLPGILGSRSFQTDERSLTVIGPVGIRKFIETALNVSKTHLRYPLMFKEMNEKGTVFENAHFSVTAAPLDHGVPSFGFRIVERDQPGELRVDKLCGMGITPGPIYRQFKEREFVTLADGRVLCAADFLGPVKKGRVTVILGDTRPCAEAADLAQGADVIVHEATFRQKDAALAHDYHHSTSVQAAKLAKSAAASMLILNHISSRYQKADQQGLLSEARSVFQQTMLATDLWTWVLGHGSSHQRHSSV
ncbi:MAG: ribonuclease Z [Sporolactobacillus sp.]